MNNQDILTARVGAVLRAGRLKGMTMLRDRHLAPHPTSTPITAQIIHGQSLSAVDFHKASSRRMLVLHIVNPDFSHIGVMIAQAIVCPENFAKERRNSSYARLCEPSSADKAPARAHKHLFTRIYSHI